MAEAQKGWNQKLFDFLDRHVSLTSGICIIQLLHIVLCYYISHNTLHTDAFCHYSWMRITHRKPLKDWYDTPDYTHLDYPPLAAYFHYLLGFITRAFDREFFYNSSTTGICELPSMAKAGLRFSVFLANSLSYNVCLTYVVLQYYKTHRTSFKLCMIFLFQFFTYYALVDFGDCQINGPHYSFFLLSLWQMTKHNFRLATFFLSLSAVYKHTAVIYALPMGLYIMFVTFQDAKQHYESLAKRTAYFLGMGIMYAGIGIFTVLAGIFPFLFYPEKLKTILYVLFYQRGFIDTAPTFWHTLHPFLRPYLNDETVPIFINITRLVLVVSLVLIWKRLSQSRTNIKFGIPYIAFTWVFFLFGYPVHTKHIAYTFLGLIFTLPLYCEYFTSLNLTLSMAMFSQSCRLESEHPVLVHSIVYCTVSWLFEQSLLASEGLYQPLPLTTKDNKKQVSLWTKAYDALIKHRKSWTGLILAVLMLYYLIYILSIYAFDYNCPAHYYPVEDVGFQSAFIMLLPSFAYSWIFFKVSP